jgi:SpoVK/Ycf46/Vps4 family AAA+-type ATPase
MKTIEVIKTGYIQWLYRGNKLYPTGKTTKIIPPGVYTTEWDSANQVAVPTSKHIDLDELFILPTSVLDRVLADIHSFWESKEKYQKYKSVYKRGILLYGIAGCGKSSVIMLLAKELISKYKGIVFVPLDESELSYTMKVLPIIKEIEPDKKIIVVLEDVDSLVGKDKDYSETVLLNFLDGAASCDGIVTIATTNYPERLKERITNRPGRFDRRYEVGKPNAEARRYYIEHKLQKSDLNSIAITKLVEETEGFTIDHLKEYILSVFVLGYSHEHAIEEVISILNTRILKNTKSENDSVGFKKEKE